MFCDKPIPESESILARLDDPEYYSYPSRYADTKLVLNAFTRSIAVAVPLGEVIVNCFCPGVVKTDMDRHIPFHHKIFIKIYRLLYSRDIVEAGRTIIYATVLAGEDTQGKFLQHNAIDTWVSCCFDFFSLSFS